MSLKIPSLPSLPSLTPDNSQHANNNDNADNSTIIKEEVIEESDRDRALREAREVTNSDGYSRLEGFNLLGVVANPRGGPIPSSSTHGTSTPSKRSTSGDVSGHGGGGSGSGSGNNSNDGSGAQEALHALEETISSVSEQLDNINVVFDSWSKQYLGTYYEEDFTEYHGPQDVPAYQLHELPPELARLHLGSVQSYIEQCGVLSHSFYTRSREKETKEWGIESSITTAEASTASEGDDDNYSNNQVEIDEDAKLMEELEQSIPGVFFETYFDLTDPKIFERLLVNFANDDDDDNENTAGGGGGDIAAATQQENNNEEPMVLESSEDLSSLHPSLRIPTKDILRLPPPDSFTGHLDKVEVALLKQVRSKSTAFFHETNRFGQLKEWIASLVKDVQTVRSILANVHEGSVTAWELIPILDARRKDLNTLQHVLESANEVIRCKSSIGGLLSAGDDLTAAEQIQYGRRLLAGNGAGVETNSSSENNSTQHDEDDEEFEMGRLQALSTVGAQLSQYEKLVVANLSEDVVEIFLQWKMSPLKSNALYGDTAASSSSTSSHMNGTSFLNLPRTSQETQQRVRDIMRGLSMCQSLTKTGKLYGNKLNDVIRMTVRTTVAGFASDEGEEDKKESSVTVGVTGMTLERFVDCLDLLFEQLLTLLKSAVGVNNFCREEGFTLKDESPDPSSATSNNSNNNVPPPPPGTPSPSTQRVATATSEAVSAAAELMAKSVSELLRLRKEVHSLVTLDEMKRLWDACLTFTLQLEKASGHKAYGLRSTLLAQAKAFVERKHESNMSALAAALDSERWTQCDVSAERQASLTRLCSGRAVSSKRHGFDDTRIDGSSAGVSSSSNEKTPDAEVEGIRYKVVWSCLLLVEMVMSDVACAAHFQTLATNVVGKVAELLRLFNSRSTNLVLGAGAIQSAARLKSINAKHLSLVAQCLGMIISILPHVRAALMAQLPPKQHTLLVDIDKIKKEYGEHSENVLNKFVSIIGGIVDQGLSTRIAGTDFDNRARSVPIPIDDSPIPCCVFLEGVSVNTKKMHTVLSSLLPPEHLQDVFSRIFASLDTKVPALFITATTPNHEGRASFSLPNTEEGKRRMLLEVETMITFLNGLPGVRPWEFTAIPVLERKMDFELRPRERIIEEEPQDEETDHNEATSIADGDPEQQTADADETKTLKIQETDSHAATDDSVASPIANGEPNQDCDEQPATITHENGEASSSIQENGTADTEVVSSKSSEEKIEEISQAEPEDGTTAASQNTERKEDT